MRGWGKGARVPLVHACGTDYLQGGSAPNPLIKWCLASKSRNHEIAHLLVSGWTLWWPMWTAVTVDTVRYWPVMVTRVPPDTGPYSGRTLSTEISPTDTASTADTYEYVQLT